MPGFTHYLVTRYNIAIQGWETDKAGQATKDSTWLEHRADLFYKYCLPSVLGQVEKGFVWLLYFNVETPKAYLREIESQLQGLHYQIRLVRNFEESVADLKQIISESPTPYAITSRLDNDDGIGKFFIRDVQNMFTEEHQTLIILEAGVVYDVAQKILTRIPHHKRNHYGSFVERCQPKENLLTIRGFAHDKKHNFKTVYVDKPNSWLKVIHERNLNSQLYGLPSNPNAILPYFHIHKDHLKVSLWNTMVYVVSRGVKKLVRTSLKMPNG